MARKSRARRLLAKQAPIATELKVLRSKAHSEEMAKLQQGSPKLTSAVRFSRVSGLSTPPRPQGWEGKGIAKNIRLEPVRVHVNSGKQRDRDALPGLVSDFLARGGKIT